MSPRTFNRYAVGLSLLIGLYLLLIEHRAGGLGAIGIGLLIASQWMSGAVRSSAEQYSLILIGILLMVLAVAFDETLRHLLFGYEEPPPLPPPP